MHRPRLTVRVDVYHLLVSALSVRGLLFTDIEGSTALVRRLGERYESVLERHHTIIRSAVVVRRGEEESREGDSLFITFRRPLRRLPVQWMHSD